MRSMVVVAVEAATSTSMMRSMVVVAVEAATSTMSVHASATSSHSSSEASVPEVASTPSYSHLPPSMYWKIASLNTATSTGDLRVVVATLVSSLGHHLANISEVHPDPVPIISELESSHLVDRGCGGVNALILDGRPPV